MKHFPTRTIEECENLVAMWYDGKKDEVIQRLGFEPNPKFLRDFKPKNSSKSAKNRGSRSN